MIGRRWNRSRPGKLPTPGSDPEPYVPDDETLKVYNAYLAEAEKRQLTSIDNFDKSILTYSSAGLALSLTFLKDFVPVAKASWTGLLYTSWVFFVLATCITIVSFLVSNKVQEWSKHDARKFFIEGLDEFKDKDRWQKRYIESSNMGAGGAFVVALATSTAFVWVNIDVRKEAAVIGSSAQGSQTIQIVYEAGCAAKVGGPVAAPPSKPIPRKPVSVPAAQISTEKSTCYCKVPNEQNK